MATSDTAATATAARGVVRRAVAVLAVLALTSGLAACGAGGDDGGAAVATLGGSAADADDDTGGDHGGTGEGPSRAEAEEAQLAFARCMREHGVDVSDPSGDGVVIAGGEGSDVDPEVMEAASEACAHHLEEVFGDMPAPSPEEQAEMRDRMLEFAACMREHGVDMPDPTFGDDGRVTIGIGGGFGDGDVGTPMEDPDFEAADEACGEIMGGAFGVAPAGGSR